MLVLRHLILKDKSIGDISGGEGTLACQTETLLHVTSWNISGTGNKLLEPEWLNLLDSNDIICIQESWATEPIFINGHLSISTPSLWAEQRGGLMVLVPLTR